MSERIAVLSTSYPERAGDAAGHFVESEVKRAARAGHEVHVLAPGRGEATRDGATLHWLPGGDAFGWPGALTRLQERPLRALGASRFCVAAARKLRELGPFARVQAHFFLPCAWPIALAARGELELVGHGSDVRLFCALPRVLRSRIARAWLSRNAQLRVTSRELERALLAAEPALAPALRVEPSPIDVDGVPSRAEARRLLGYDERPRALVIARLIPGKQVDRALSALSLCAGVQAVVIGDGPELTRLRASFPEAHFLGYLPRDRALLHLSAADVLLSASEREGAPSVVREARALDVPVVSVAAGDLVEWAASDPGILIAR